MVFFSLTPKEKHIKTQLISDVPNGFAESKTEAEVYIPELGTYSCFKEVADSPSLLSRGRPCNEMGYSWQFSIGPAMFSSKTRCNPKA